MTGAWWQVKVACPASETDRLAAAMVAATGQGVEEPEPGKLATVCEDEAGANRMLAKLMADFPGISGEVHRLDPVDWSVQWRDGIRTRRFGRLIVTPSWLPVDASPDQVVLVLDPESAFGSGEHGSTRAALTLLERHLQPGWRVLDFGSGSGILAIAAVLLGAGGAVGIEVDEDANPIAEANARRNRVDSRLTFLAGDAAALHGLFGPVQLVCSNILRNVNTMLLPSIESALLPGGIAIFSGMEIAEEPLFRPVLESAGWDVIDTTEDAGWWAVAARRPG